MAGLLTFQLRTAEAIAATMLLAFRDHTTAVTDLTEGSVVRSLHEAVAVELQALNAATLALVAQAVQDGLFGTLGFTRHEPVAAYGVERFARKLLAVPTGVTRALAAGGSLSTSLTYYYQVTATNAAGETTGSAVTTGLQPTSGNQKIIVSWTAVTGATGYRVYRAENSAMTTNVTYYVLGSGTTVSYTDDGTGGTAGSVPAANTAQVVTGAVKIAGGTRVGIPGTAKVYVVPSEVTMGASANTLDVTVTCLTAGVIGNTTAATVTQLLTANAAIASVTNPKAFTTGKDMENLEDMRSRFVSFLLALGRGTSVSLEEGAKTAVLVDANGFVTERVTQALAVQGAVGNGTLYAYNGNPSTVPADGESVALLDWVDQLIQGYTDEQGTVIPGYKAAGVVVTVDAATRVTQAVTAVLALAPNMIDSGTDSIVRVRASAVQAIDDYFAGLRIADGSTVTFRRSALAAAMQSVPGVIGASITVPATETVAQNVGEVLVAGTKTLS